MSDQEKSQTSHEKGQRNEREAANILGRVKGNVDKVDAFTNHDPLGFIDVLAAKDPYPVRFVQVKTNRFTREDKTHYAARASLFHDGVRPEVWVRVDLKGWRFYQFVASNDEWRCFLEMDTCDYEETVEEFRKATGFYQIKEATE